MATAGVIVGVFFVAVGMTPWEYVAGFLQQPPSWITSVWFSPGMVLVGLATIAFSLWFNLWSQKQKAIDDLAEEMAWAIHNILNRKPRPSTADEIALWEKDFRDWCDKVSRQLENRSFFTRADQLHFDRLGFVEPLTMSGHQHLDWLLSQLRMKFERLRDVINWTQQRRR